MDIRDDQRDLLGAGAGVGAGAVRLEDRTWLTDIETAVSPSVELQQWSSGALTAYSPDLRTTESPGPPDLHWDCRHSPPAQTLSGTGRQREDIQFVLPLFDAS